MISRFDEDDARGHLDALKARGLQARFVDGQNGEEDFCFLMSAQKEMAGCAYSTYLFWAGYLSNATRVLAYSVDSAERRRTGREVYHRYDWANPDLHSRFVFKLVKPTG